MIQEYGSSHHTKKTMTKPELEEYVRKHRADDDTPVTGIFINKESPGQKKDFSYKWWPGQPRQRVTLYDGERYTLPKGIVRWIKKHCSYPDYEHISSQAGLGGIRAGTGSQDGSVPIQENWRVKRMINRFDFELTSYVPGFYEELNAPKLFTVEMDLPKQAIITKG